MKKKLLIALGVLLLVAFTSAVTYAVTSGSLSGKQPSKPSEYNVGVSYDAAMTGNKPVVALFYVDWCGYCMRFMPKFKTLESAYKGKYNFLMINAEDPARVDIVRDVRLSGYPTVFILDPKYNNRVHLNNTLYGDLTAFRVELDRYLNIRKTLDRASSCSK